MTQKEMTELARRLHEENGHFKQDSMKLRLVDKYCSTRIDQSIVRAINDCGRCKSFGAPHIHSLLEPITRRHPFELIVADYLSMPAGTGGFHTVALVMDVFSRYRWGFKLKTKGTAKTTIAALKFICNLFTTPEALMTDGGSHFNCRAVSDFCADQGIELRIISPYSPWIAGLIENSNGNLLSVLRKICSARYAHRVWGKTTTRKCNGLTYQRIGRHTLMKQFGSLIIGCCPRCSALQLS